MDQEPREPSAEGAAYDALRRLEARLDRASDVAERLIAEVAARASSAANAPPADAPPADTPPTQQPQTPAADGQARPDDPPTASSDEQTPPGGWQAPAGDDRADQPGELELLAQVLRSLRDLIPPELQRKLAEALRELLLALRALIDWYLERVERRHRPQAEVQDIPIL
jgi:hypothetical protein